MLKAELLQVAKLVPVQKEYETDRMAREFNQRHGTEIKVLRLPIGHCELNPIELIWSQLKRKIATRNRTFKIRDVQRLATEIAKEITAEDWEKCIDHARGVESFYREKDGVMDNVEVQPLVIDLEDKDGDDEIDFIVSDIGDIQYTDET